MKNKITCRGSFANGTTLSTNNPLQNSMPNDNNKTMPFGDNRTNYFNHLSPIGVSVRLAPSGEVENTDFITPPTLPPYRETVQNRPWCSLAVQRTRTRWHICTSV